MMINKGVKKEKKELLKKKKYMHQNMLSKLFMVQMLIENNALLLAITWYDLYSREIDLS